MRPKTPYHKCRASISPQPVDQLELPYQNPFDLIQTDRVVRAVIQLGRARRLVVGDLLRVLVGQPLNSSQRGNSTGSGYTLTRSRPTPASASAGQLLD